MQMGEPMLKAEGNLLQGHASEQNGIPPRNDRVCMGFSRAVAPSSTHTHNAEEAPSLGTRLMCRAKGIPWRP